MRNNDIFHLDDPHSQNFEGFQLSEGWWSRHYEYPWAAKFAAPGSTVVDMGYGWMGRPFKDYLARVCETVYGVDIKPSTENQLPNNFIPLVEDFSTGTSLPDNSMDTVFCISVLEDVKNVEQTLQEFKRVVTPGGQIILTFDIPNDPRMGNPFYPGLSFDLMRSGVSNVGLRWLGGVGYDISHAVVHKKYNLSVYHAVLEAA